MSRSIRLTSSNNPVTTYKLNGEDSTQKVFHRLLGAANARPDGYNIVLQGDVTSLAKMTANERRKVLDNVAGVTSYGDRTCSSYGVNTRADVYLDFLGVPGGSPTPPTSPAPEPEPEPEPGPEPTPTPVAQTFRDSGSLSQGRAQFYDAIPVTPGTPFRAVLSGTGDGDLYVQWNTRPTSRSYACRVSVQACGVGAARSRAPLTSLLGGPGEGGLPNEATTAPS